MSGKYIDLADRISEDTNSYNPAIKRVLRWLDGHPDRVPGRTITESEVYDHVADDTRMHGAFVQGFVAAGGTVVPDPEPTNAEKWEKFIREGNPGLPEPDVEDMAAHLDLFGVKAPGGDDD